LTAKQWLFLVVISLDGSALSCPCISALLPWDLAGVPFVVATTAAVGRCVHLQQWYL